MNTEFYTQTYQMLKDYLTETAEVFEKIDKEPGFFYKKSRGELSLVFCVRLDEELGALLFSAYPGIYARQCYVPTVADYCLRYSPEIGTLCVEPDLCEVCYRTEVFMQDAPVSRDVQEILESTAFEALSPHIENLRALGAGILPESFPPEILYFPQMPRPTHAEDYLPLMEKFFKSYNMNIVAKHEPDAYGNCFVCEFLLQHRRWKLHVTLDDEKTYFLFRLFPGRNALTFNAYGRHAAAQICNKENTDIKTGALAFGSHAEGVCAKTAVFALSEVTSLDETLFSVLSVLISVLYHSIGALEKAAAGVPVELRDFASDEGEEPHDPEYTRKAFFERLKKLESMQKFLALTANAKKPHDEDIPPENIPEIEDDDPNPVPFD